MKKQCKFGHPLKKNNLKGKKCGTCIMAKEFRDTANQLTNIAPNETLKKILNDLAVLFEKGEVLYDSNGETLSEIADKARKGS